MIAQTDGRIFSSAAQGCRQTTLLRHRLASWVYIEDRVNKFSKGGSVKEYVNYVNVPDYRDLTA
jgi:hypothetical protein